MSAQQPPVQHTQIFLHDPEDNDNKLELLEYWRSVVKRKKQIISFALALMILATVIVFAMTPIYRSTVTVLIESGKSKVVTIEDVYSGAGTNREYFQTQVEILKSREVAINAIKKLKLWELEDFDPRPKGESVLRDLLVSIGLQEDPETIEWTDDVLAEAIYPGFAKAISVEPVRLSQLVKVSFDSKSPGLSAKIANAIAQSYISNEMDQRLAMTQMASTWIQGRLETLKDTLEKSERELQEYRDKNGIVDRRTQQQSGAGLQMAEVTGRLVEAKLRRAESENAYNQIKLAKQRGELATLPAVTNNPIVSEALSQQSQAERRLAEVSQRYGSEHPRYLQAVAELKSAKDSVQRQIDTIVTGIMQQYEVAKGTERTLEGVMARARGSVQDDNRQEFDLNLLEREVDSNRKIYEMFVVRSKETAISGDLQTPIARVVESAQPAKSPVKPKKLQIIVIALVLGLFMGALAALMLDRLDNTLKSTEDVEFKLKTPLLASLPLLPKAETERQSTARIFIDEPKSLYAEAIRVARTGVLLSAIDIPKRLLLVTSSLPSEGKTTFSINLALAHAHTKKTLLIDADMRRPAVAKGLGLTAGARGLSDLVSGTATLDQCLVSYEGSEVKILPSGTIPPNPVELLLSNRFKETMESLQEQFDIIIIDTPPVELVTDALVISPYATGIIYVAKAESTPYPLARKGISRLRRAKGQILGVVLNRLDFAKAEKYYGDYSGYSHYGYGYGYSSVYGETPETKA